MCRRCTVPTNKTAATQTCWPSATKSIQVCPSTYNKSVMYKNQLAITYVQVACHMKDVSTTSTPIGHTSCNPSFLDHNYAGDAMPEANKPHSHLVEKEVWNEFGDDDLPASDIDSDPDYCHSDTSDDAWMDDEMLKSARPSNNYDVSSHQRMCLVYEETLKKLCSQCQY